MKKLVDECLALKLQLNGVPSSGIFASMDAVTNTVQRERTVLGLYTAPYGTVTTTFSYIEDSTVLTKCPGDQAW